MQLNVSLFFITESYYTKCPFQTKYGIVCPILGWVVGGTEIKTKAGKKWREGGVCN